MNEQALRNYGITLLRVSLGTIFIAHSLYLKLVIFTLPGTAQFFGSIGLPPQLAYLVFAMEALGGIALLAGFQTRWVALVLTPVALGATWAHSGAGWLFTNTGGGWEYPLFLAVAVFSQALLGDGALAIQRSSPLGRWGQRQPVTA
ncbi:MAG: DoxX family protein [Hahellaceae bacterium]|nr:DoxX family protein [Hahellaceae bacterium]MCP5170134.1 DoxX family protein [Hahellaceae bacterium]